MSQNNMQDLIGHTLDGKYRIEKEIGRGGMGAVYFAVHLGTKRPVALKVIVPQFMQRAEFVERFRREAEAAGRLRHPNVVNVTDFGFAETNGGRVAYLVMEYLDGCNLGEILEEEKKLSTAWTIDILEQVCAAVGEAHRQGIVHRDLKPDNIWLEPNERGGYTVKVLDFGIAKLETATRNFNLDAVKSSASSSAATLPFNARKEQNATEMMPSENIKTGYETVLNVDVNSASESFPVVARSENSESKTLSQIETLTDDNATQHLPAKTAADKDNFYAKTTGEITRVGAIMGTPLYMSPEQCRGERLSMSSDIYSLGVIAYQMLAGKTPFAGEQISVMTGHLQFAPPSFSSFKVPRKVKKVIYTALAKEPVKRPPTAEMFAAQMRSHSESIWRIFRRSLVICIENFSKLIWFSLLLYFPTILLGILMFFVSVLGLKNFAPANVLTITQFLLKTINIASAITGETLITAAVTWIVVRYLNTPLQSFRVLAALHALLEKWKNFAWILPLRFVINFLIQGDLTGFSAQTMLVLSYLDSLLFFTLPCVVMMENLRGFAVLKRSWKLSLKAVPTILAAAFLNSLIYLIFGAAIAIVVFNLMSFAAQNFMSFAAEMPFEDFVKLTNGIALIFVKIAGTIILPFFAVVTTLIYLKTRHAGGESLKSLLDEFKQSNVQKRNWQKKIRHRLELSKRIADSFISR